VTAPHGDAFERLPARQRNEPHGEDRRPTGPFIALCSAFFHKFIFKKSSFDNLNVVFSGAYGLTTFLGLILMEIPRF
jgi:hypothetical protein